MTKPVIVFDVNETLLDMSPLRQKVNALLQNEQGFKIWFGMMLQYSLVENATGSYHAFPEIAEATLGMAAAAFDKTVSDDQKKEVLGLIMQLPAYPDVKVGLTQLQEAGFRLITLTNSPDDTLKKQLAFAGIAHFFELHLSIHQVKKYKPAPETYNYAARETGVEAGNLLMVAAHGWDMAGAINAGMLTAFVERKGQALYSLSPNPNFVCRDVADVAKQIIENF